MQQGAVMAELITDIRAVAKAVADVEGPAFAAIAQHLTAGVDALEQASTWMLQTLARDPAAALASSVNYMMLAGYVSGGWLMARAALAANAALKEHPADDFYKAKITTAAFYAEQILPKASALLTTVQAGSSYAPELPVEQF